jgi:hypothetical protein
MPGSFSVWGGGVHILCKAPTKIHVTCTTSSKLAPEFGEEELNQDIVSLKTIPRRNRVTRVCHGTVLKLSQPETLPMTLL